VIYNLLFLVGFGGPGTSHARGAALQAREGRSMPLVRLPRAKREKSLGPARRRRVGRLHRGLHNGAPHPTSHHGSRWADQVSSSTMVQKAMGHFGCGCHHLFPASSLPSPPLGHPAALCAACGRRNRPRVASSDPEPHAGVARLGCCLVRPNPACVAAPEEEGMPALSSVHMRAPGA